MQTAKSGCINEAYVSGSVARFAEAQPVIDALCKALRRPGKLTPREIVFLLSKLSKLCDESVQMNDEQLVGSVDRLFNESFVVLLVSDYDFDNCPHGYKTANAKHSSMV